MLIALGFPNLRYVLDLLKGPGLIYEVNVVVRQCESDKSLGPNGFMFKFVKKYWQMLQNDILIFVSKVQATIVM